MGMFDQEEGLIIDREAREIMVGSLGRPTVSAPVIYLCVFFLLSFYDHK